MKPRHPQRGQAVIELAITLPVVVLLALVVLQMAVIGRDQLALWHAARVAVRAAAVSLEPGADADAAAQVATTLRPIEVSTDSDDEWVHVALQHTSRTRVALVGVMVPDVTLHAHATMRREPP